MAKKNFWLGILVMVLVFGTTFVGCIGFDAKESANDDEISWNNHRYKRIEQSKTWTEAKSHCETLGGHLATITSAAESEAVNKLVAKGNKNIYWIGGRRTNGSWVWVTGEEWGYTNWAPEEPNNLGGSESYIQIYRKNIEGITNSIGKWNDLENAGDVGGYSLANSGYICEWEN